MNPISTSSNTLTIIDKDSHRRRRKGLSPAFSEHALRSFEPIIIKNVDIMLGKLQESTSQTSSESRWSDSVNMIERSKYFTFDVMTAFGFGRSFNAQIEDTNRGILLGMRTGSMLSGICVQYPRLRHYKAVIERLIRPSNTWTRERFANFMRQVVKTRLTEPKDATRDLFSFIIGSKTNAADEGLTLDELWMESRMLMLAGEYSQINIKISSCLASRDGYYSECPCSHVVLPLPLSKML